MAAPFLLIVAGPNGSGKTTLTNSLRRLGLDFGEYINPDDIAPGLEGSYEARVREAQSIADRLREDCITRRRSFSFETVMSHPSKIDVMRQARDAGFEVTLFFVAVDDPVTNVARVGQRVAKGGHDVPNDKILARYQRALFLLPLAILTAHHSFIFDNTELRPRLIAKIENVDGALSFRSAGGASAQWFDPILEGLAETKGLLPP